MSHKAVIIITIDNFDELMSNIMNVTGFLRNKINLSGGNAARETLTFLYTKENTPYYRDENGGCCTLGELIHNGSEIARL